MTVRTIAVPVAAAAALAVGLAGAAPVSATPEARITGKFRVLEQYQKHKSNPSDVGKTLDRTWRFTPTCKAGGCKTKLRFRNSDGLIVYKLERLSNLKYKGTTTYDGKCYAKSDGSVLDRDAYNVTSTVTVNIDQVGPNGGVGSFSTLRKVWHDRKAGASKQCDKTDFAKLKGYSQGRP